MDKMTEHVMNWTTDAFLKKLYEDTSAERLQLAEATSLQEQRSRLAQALRRALGAFPEHSGPLNPVLLKRRDYGDYTLEKVAYTTLDGVNVPVLILIPKGKRKRYPAVLACHGHGNGQWDAVGMDPQGQELDDPGIHNRVAVRLVKLGLVVVIPEIMGFGVRRMAAELEENPNYSSCATLSSQLLMYGRTLAGMRVYEAMRALDYINSRSDVDAKRVGIFGFSGGGLIAAYTAALDERIKAVALSGWTNTFQGSILAMHHCIDNYLPGLLLDAEQPDLIGGLLAPRPLFVEGGEQDPIFPVAHTRRTVAELENRYALWNASDRFQYELHAGGHEISGKLSFDWLHRQLSEDE